jgi:hypothetical protein
MAQEPEGSSPQSQQPTEARPRLITVLEYNYYENT